MNFDKRVGRQRASRRAAFLWWGLKKARNRGFGLGSSRRFLFLLCFADQFGEADSARLNPLVSERLPHVLPTGPASPENIDRALIFVK